MTTLSGDRWEGIRDDAWTLDRPTAADVERAVARMDARSYTMITIAHEAPKHLCVGGGAGQYVVYASLIEDEFWKLHRSDPVFGKIRLTCGGQPGDFEAQRVVTLEQARAAAVFFLERGALDPSLRWEQQLPTSALDGGRTHRR